ncbi:MAG TPA: winged helix-turn-helix domain-containing protein [Ferruginibacter sp.]|nr:winged helix-turn-helix domain-containing protein [Ferruginibacter sp.]
MPTGHFKTGLLFFINIILFAITGYAQADKAEKHILVSMRMIGHKVLLHSGDSSSLVLPVEKEAGGYRIRFASEFEFSPEKLVAIVDSVVKASGIASRYIAGVVRCATGEVVYSFEKGNRAEDDLVPCGTRMQGKDCYSILITVLDAAAPGKKQANYFIIALLALAIAGLPPLFIYARKKKPEPLITAADPGLLAIGAYRFDRVNAELLIGDQKIALSAKESDLLLLLYNAANTTVEREAILKNVWGDEGAYVGRTLDVFISKLRRKLEVDTSVKIVNIRGIGYKLLVNVRC